MKPCKPFNNFHYRVFEHYFGKCDFSMAICDVYDKDVAERIVEVFSEYYKKRPFEFYLKEIVYDK